MLRVGFFLGVPDEPDKGPDRWEGCSLCTRPLVGPLIRLGSRKQTRWFHRECLVGVLDESFETHPDEMVTEWERRRRERDRRRQLAEDILASYRSKIRERERSRRSHPNACPNAERDPSEESRSNESLLRYGYS